MGCGRVAVVAGRVVLAFAVVVVIGCAPRARTRVRVAAPPPVVSDWPRREVLDLAIRAWDCGRRYGDFTSDMLTVIDYSLPSTERRLWVIDVPAWRVVNHEFVAHGQGSGDNMAVAFSNDPGSRQSSLGLFRTEETYIGGQGYSLRLTGLEPGINDHAMERNIVVHGADYVGSNVIAEHGRLGRSWGCPALARDVSHGIIDRIKGGSALFAYYPDAAWIQTSRFLQCGAVQVAGR